MIDYFVFNFVCGVERYLYLSGGNRTVESLCEYVKRLQSFGKRAIRSYLSYTAQRKISKTPFYFGYIARARAPVYLATASMRRSGREWKRRWLFAVVVQRHGGAAEVQVFPPDRDKRTTKWTKRSPAASS